MKSTSRIASLLFAFLPALALGQTNSIWAPTVVPSSVDGGDGQPVELGLQFRSDVAGSVTGVRFYKASANKGAHTGNLWTSSGTLLATVTFANETASGWQQALFATPVTIQANTTYVVSYYTTTGHYSFSKSYFASAATDNAPLHAPSGANGVYKYGSQSGFPKSTWSSSNYWVDVVFQSGSGTSAAATATTVTSSANPSTAGQSVTITATVTSGSGTPTGTVQIRDGSTVLSTNTLTNGKASLVTSSLATGTHTITAAYTGNSSFLASTSAAVVQTVTSSTGTTTSLSSSLNPSTVGQAVTLTGTVWAASGSPTGSVVFKDGSTVLATATLGSGKAAFTTSALSVGTHTITASYGGDGTHSASASPAFSQQVQAVVAHSATLTWATGGSSGVVGYNVYRSATSGGPYVRLNSSPVSATTYTDTTVQAGQTYYYVCTTVNSSGAESGYSNQTQATVPTP